MLTPRNVCVTKKIDFACTLKGNAVINCFSGALKYEAPFFCNLQLKAMWIYGIINNKTKQVFICKKL